ncbi:MAG: hypothetical protein IJO43_02220 [Bacilli bacterium]|nr:hypothetical protein [Bacilli bacterium]
MKIKKILIYLIFAFVMILPFSVNAEVRTENFQILHNKDFSSTLINQLKEVFYYKMCPYGCSGIDDFYENTPILIDYNENDQTFDVYYSNRGYGKDREIIIDDSGVRFIINSYISDGRWHDVTLYRFQLDDLSFISNKTYGGRTYFDILSRSNYVCIGDLHNNCGNTSLSIIGNRDMEFWEKHNLYDTKTGMFNYDNFNDLYVYSSIVWTNYNFTWGDGIVFESLNNYEGYEYKAFTYNLDSDGSYSDKFTTSKTILIDASLYDTYELKFELIGKHFNCTAPINVFNICPDKYRDYQDKYIINVYNKAISNVKYYLSADNKSWDKISFNASSTDDYISYTDIKWNGKYGKYIFDLTGIDDYVLITISYDNDIISFKTPELQIPEEEMTEVDLKGKYAIGLIPKNISSPVPLYYQGNFVSYYYFGDSTSAYEYKILKSTDHISKHVIDFSNYNLNKPIFYILNLDHKTQNTSIVKYYAEYFDVIYFENDYSSVTYNDFVYNPPSSSVDVATGGDDSSDSSGKGIDLSLTSLVKKLPDLISGLSSAFQALGDCVVIAFTSLPEIVQSVLYICLIVTVILIAIKLIK